MAAPIIKPLTPAQWDRLCQTIATTPGREPWLLARNEAMALFCYSFGTRALETSKYTRQEVFERPGVLRDQIPLGSLVLRYSERLPWVWRITPPTLGEALLRYDALYPARRDPDMPLWISRKAKTARGFLCRESVFRPIKEAGRACGLGWVNLECVRMTRMCQGVREQIARDNPRTGPEFGRIIEAAQQEMRHKTIQRTWVMLKRGHVI